MASAYDVQGSSPLPLQGTSPVGVSACSQGPLSLGSIKGFLQMQLWSFCVPAPASSLIPQSCFPPWT